MKHLPCGIILLLLLFNASNCSQTSLTESNNSTTPVSTTEEPTESPTRCPGTVNIVSIQTNAECSFMNVRTQINEDRKRFDIFVRMHREMGSNYLLMNLKLKVRPQGANSFQTLFFWRRVDFCAFLTDVQHSALMQFFFKKSIQLAEVITCPVRKGNYTLLNLGVIDSMVTMEHGTYKFFVEIVQATGEIAKVFAMQMRTEIEAC